MFVISVLPTMIALIRQISLPSILGVLFVNVIGVVLVIFPAGATSFFRPVTPDAGMFMYLIAFVWACTMPNRINREAVERRHYELLRAIQKLGLPKTGATGTTPAPTQMLPQQSGS